LPVENAQEKKTVNLLLLLLTLISGVVWGLLGELYLDQVLDSIPDIPVVGLYFAAFLAIVILACLVSESIVASLVPARFFIRYTLHALKFSVPIVLATMFAIGCLIQFLYGLAVFTTENTVTAWEEKTVFDEVETFEEKEVITGVEKTPVPQVVSEIDDYYFIIDDSASMTWNDPSNKRILLINNIVSRLSDTKRVMLVKFGSTAVILLGLAYCTVDTKRRFSEEAMKFYSNDSTDIIYALQIASPYIDSKRRGAAILVTDGLSHENGLSDAIGPYIAAKIPIYSIMLGKDVNLKLLHKISDPTGGKVTAVDNFSDFEKEVLRSMQLPETEYITTIERTPKTELVPRIEYVPVSKKVRGTEWKQVRNLLTKRVDIMEDSPAYVFMRIVMIALIGSAMGYGIAFVFQHRSLDIPFSIGGLLSGIIAGLVLEMGLQGDASAPLIRAIHDVILAAVLWVLVWCTAFVSKYLFHKDPIEWFVTNRWDAGIDLDAGSIEKSYRTIPDSGGSDMGEYTIDVKQSSGKSGVFEIDPPDRTRTDSSKKTIE
jgi:Ca-activated chloride channel family protein